MNAVDNLNRAPADRFTQLIGGVGELAGSGVQVAAGILSVVGTVVPFLPVVGSAVALGSGLLAVLGDWRELSKLQAARDELISSGVVGGHQLIVDLDAKIRWMKVALAVDLLFSAFAGTLLALDFLLTFSGMPIMSLVASAALGLYALCRGGAFIHYHATLSDWTGAASTEVTRVTREAREEAQRVQAEQRRAQVQAEQRRAQEQAEQRRAQEQAEAEAKRKQEAADAEIAKGLQAEANPNQEAEAEAKRNQEAEDAKIAERLQSEADAEADAEAAAEAAEAAEVKRRQQAEDKGLQEEAVAAAEKKHREEELQKNAWEFAECKEFFPETTDGAPAWVTLPLLAELKGLKLLLNDDGKKIAGDHAQAWKIKLIEIIKNCSEQPSQSNPPTAESLLNAETRIQIFGSCLEIEVTNITLSRNALIECCLNKGCTVEELSECMEDCIDLEVKEDSWLLPSGHRISDRAMRNFTNPSTYDGNTTKPIHPITRAPMEICEVTISPSQSGNCQNVILATPSSNEKRRIIKDSTPDLLTQSILKKIENSNELLYQAIVQ